MKSKDKSQSKIGNWQALLVLVVVMGVLASGCGTAAPKVYHVGIMYGVDAHSSVADGLKAKMTELGYVEGKNIIYDMQKSSNDRADDQRIAQKFVADKVDLIFAIQTQQSLAAKAATQGTNIPVVFTFSTIEQTGLVDGVRNPGANITGVRYPLPEVTAQRFELLYQMTPHMTRLWIARDLNYPTSRVALEALRPAAAAKGVTLVEVDAPKVEDISADLEARSASSDIGLDAMLIMPEPNPQSPAGWGAINKFAAEHKVPVGGQTAAQAKEGALFTLVPDLVEVGKLSASLVDKILKGTAPGSLPVVTPNIYLTLNYQVAQELGLAVPEGLLSQAAQIIR